MARDLLWVCDELAKLHQDLQAIREAAEQAQRDGDLLAEDTSRRAGDALARDQEREGSLAHA